MISRSGIKQLVLSSWSCVHEDHQHLQFRCAGKTHGTQLACTLGHSFTKKLKHIIFGNIAQQVEYLRIMRWDSVIKSQSRNAGWGIYLTFFCCCWP